ncbi:retrovirus-related pol polyprotein from transposon TNT 1-94 [Tanacetum coccineum]
MQLSTEQAFWLPLSNPKFKQPDIIQTPVEIEIPKELPKISLVKTSFQKLKNHLASFDKVVKVRTTPDAITRGSWGFEPTKKVFKEDDIPFINSLRAPFKDFENGLHIELNEVKMVLNQMEAAVEQCSVDKKYFDIQKKEVSLDNDRLLDYIIGQYVMNIMMHADFFLAKVSPADNKCLVNDNLESERLEQENDHLFELLLSQDIVHICVYSLALRNDCREMQQSFIDEYNENLMLKAELAKNGQMVEKTIFDKVVHRSRLDAKDVSIANLRKHIEKLKGKNVVEKDIRLNNPNVIAPKMFKLDLAPLAPKLLNNRDAHIDYIKHSREHAYILCEIVEHAKALRPLDSDLDSVSKIVKRIQEVLVYVKDTCPSLTKPSEKLVIVTPLNKNKKVRSAEATTSSRMKSSTIASKSQPSGNTKHNRILQTTSSNMKNKVEDHPRSVYYVEGLGHNLFFIGQFCDSDLEVAFRKHTCYIRVLEGVDLLKGSRGLKIIHFVFGRYDGVLSHLSLVKSFKDKVLVMALKEKAVAIVSLDCGMSFSCSGSSSICLRLMWTHAKSSSLGVVEEFHDIEVAHLNNDPFFDVSIPEPSSKESYLRDAILTNVHSVNQPPENLSKWTKDHPLDNVKLDELGGILKNKARLVAMGYHQEEGIELEESFAPVYVSQLDGFVDQDNPNHMYKLKKALYGLERAPRDLHDLLSSFLLSQKLSKGTVDPTLFTRKEGKDILLMSKMGKMSFFLGLQISQSPRGIFLNQSKYALEIIKKYGMETSDPVGTPMLEKSKLDADPQGKEVNPTCYHGIIGSLMYLTSSILDLKDSYIALTAFADADHASCQETRRSTSSSMQLLGDRLVSWSSKKQKSTSISSTKAEYIALSEQVENRVVELYIVRIEYQLADILTKSLGRERLEFLINKLGMRSMSPEMLKSLADKEEERWWHIFLITNQEEIRQVIARDEKWVPTKERVKINTPNVRLETSYTVKKVKGTKSYEFLLANKKCSADDEVIRKILDICPRVQGVNLTEVSDDETTFTFLIGLGYKGLLYMYPSMYVDHMHKPWRTLAVIINKCVSEKAASNDRLRKSRIDILRGMFYKENVDYRKLIWEDLAFQIDHWQLKKGRHENMPYPSFTKIIIEYFLSKHQSLTKLQYSHTHTIKDDCFVSRSKFVRIGEDFQEYGLPIPDTMLTEGIKQLKSY